MRYPDLPPQVLENLETNKVRYAIGDDEVLEFFCQDGLCKTMRN
ncbi:hypothetical protein JCM19237_6343 [Photobacterium aphoticum]|uniref:Uncharacterized protein n=1 Tax=Photobacterium aphoticum TaxID=754436 RepID=A0A090QNR2_9GAMM|nr:hypothetical protein JCM19237_6343 [Photobacterium aphoticum]